MNYFVKRVCSVDLRSPQSHTQLDIELKAIACDCLGLLTGLLSDKSQNRNLRPPAPVNTSDTTNSEFSLDLEWRFYLGEGMPVACAFRTSSKQKEFSAEVDIHFPDLRDVNERGVLVFPRLLICLDCGYSSFITPAPELARLRAADKPLAR